MDDKNRTAFAVLLSIVVILLYTQWVTAPYKQSPAVPVPTTQGAAAPVTSQGASDSVTTTSANIATQAVPFSEETFLAAPRTVIETESMVITINHLGARIEKLELKGYKKQLNSSELMDLVAVKANAERPMAVQFGDNQTDNNLLYQQVTSPGLDRFVINGSDSRTITFQAHRPGGTFQKEFTFKSKNHLFDVTLAPATAAKFLRWDRTVPLNDPEQTNYVQKDVITLDGLGTQHSTPSSNVLEGLKGLGDVRWVTLADKYFMVSFIPRGKTADAQVVRSGDVITTGISGSVGSFTVYAGPREIDELTLAGFSLERNVDLGFFAFLAQPILSILKTFNNWLGNFGLAIIAFTLLVKALFLPLAKISFRSMKKLQDIAPEIQALREKYTDSAELNRETMALYQKKGVNPLGGCLPILVQIPVFFGLYSALLHAIEMRHSRFALWIDDLSAPEHLLLFGIPVPVMILLLGASMYYQQKTTPNTMTDPVQRKVFAMMPLIFTGMFILFPMPSGLVVYWLVNNLISIVQQLYLRSHNGVGAGRATLLASAVMFGIGFALTKIPM